MELNFEATTYSGLAGPTSSLDFPKMLHYRDTPKESGESTLTLGVQGDGNPISVDLDNDSPHVLVSAGSGAGKSVIARSLATQALLKGYTVVFLDIKQISHRWAWNLPGVHYASSAEEIGNALVSVATEVQRRMRIIRDFPGPIDEAPVGPRILLVYEEMNSAVDAIKAMDKQLPPRGVYKASNGFGDIMNLGRAAKVHVVGFAQYADNQTIPTRWRESFGYRALIRHSSNSWNMLAWQCGYCPPAPQQPGRGFVVQGDKARETQFSYISEEEAAERVREARGRRLPKTPVIPPRPAREQRKDALQRLAREDLRKRMRTDDYQAALKGVVSGKWY